MKHPTLTLLGAPIETDDGDFIDLAYARTVLGDVSFSRMSKEDGWVWHLTTWRKQIDDFGSLEDHWERPFGLEAAVRRAERSLSAILKRAHSAPSPLEELARETSNTALRKIRNDFQTRYGSYLKCADCGRFLRTHDPVPFEGPDDQFDPVACSAHGSGRITTNGYAPPPEEPK